jgi:hypothetical protein
VCVCVWQLGCVEDYYIIIVQRAVKRAHALHGADSRSPEKLGCDEWRVGQQWGIGKQAVVGMGQLASIYPVEEDMMPRSAGGQTLQFAGSKVTQIAHWLLARHVLTGEADEVG